jgi:monoamine oxidase
VVLQFRECFWPEQVGFVHTFGDWIPTWWTSENRLTLTGWAGGPRGEKAAEADAQTLMVRSVDALARTFGQRPEKVQRLLQELYTHNWCADPCARMAYSFVTAGHEDAPHRLAAPVADTLFFAGEATSLDAQNGTVHGALASGMRAACEFQQSLSSPEAEVAALTVNQPQ